MRKNLPTESRSGPGLYLPYSFFNDSKTIFTKDNNKHIPIIEIIGDSHLNAIDPTGLSNKKNVIIRNHPNATTEDINSHIVPSLKKKRDVIIIHSGSNDLTNDIDTIQHMQSLVNKIRHKSANTKIAISSIFIRTDKNDLKQRVINLNAKLKSFCDDNLLDFIVHNNIDETCLGQKKLHLNKKGLVNLQQT